MKLTFWLLLVLVLVASTPGLSFANGTVQVFDGTNDELVAITNQAAPNVEEAPGPPISLYYVDYIDLTEASVSLSGGSYTFELTTLGNVAPASPSFPQLPGHPVQEVRYRWRIFQCLFPCFPLGAVVVEWIDGAWSAFMEVYVSIDCPGNPAGPDCRALDAPRTALSFARDSSGKSLSVAVSQTDFSNFMSQSLFGTTPVRWKAQASVFLNAPLPGVSSGPITVFDFAPDSGRPLLPT